MMENEEESIKKYLEGKMRLIFTLENYKWEG